jgi:hypothetical protein
MNVELGPLTITPISQEEVPAIVSKGRPEIVVVVPWKRLVAEAENGIGHEIIHTARSWFSVSSSGRLAAKNTKAVVVVRDGRVFMVPESWMWSDE